MHNAHACTHTSAHAICIHTRACHTHTHTRRHAHVHTHSPTSMCTCGHMHTWTHTCAHVYSRHTNLPAHTHMPSQSRVHTHMCIHAHTHLLTHAHPLTLLCIHTCAWAFPFGTHSPLKHCTLQPPEIRGFRAELQFSLTFTHSEGHGVAQERRVLNPRSELSLSTAHCAWILAVRCGLAVSYQ